MVKTVFSDGAFSARSSALMCDRSVLAFSANSSWVRCFCRRSSRSTAPNASADPFRSPIRERRLTHPSASVCIQLYARQLERESIHQSESVKAPHCAENWHASSGGNAIFGRSRWGDPWTPSSRHQGTRARSWLLHVDLQTEE